MAYSPRSRPLILIVDDDEMERFLQREVLETAGFDIIDADGGAAGLLLFAEHRPDLVVLDVMMPEFNGFEVCEAIRAMPGGRDAPVLMATALDDIDSIDRAYRAGATDFIGKPINWSILPHHVRYILRSHDTLQKLIVSQHQLAEAQRIAGIANFQWLPQRATVECSAELCRILRLGDDDQAVSPRSLLRRLPAAERRAVIRAVRRGLAGDSVNLDLRLDAARTLCLRAELAQAGDGTAHLRGSVQDITERKRVEIELAEARDQARSADAAKTAFLAAMTHELRTPLNAIIGFSDLIAQQAYGPIAEDRYVEYARSSEKAGKQMLALVGDLLTIAQLEAGRFELLPERIDLAAAVERAVAEFRDSEAGSKHTITMAVEGAPKPINADLRAVKQMAQKLLSNAAKFSAQGTAIRVTVGAEGEASTRVSIADQGIGISEEMAALAISPFRQADGRLSREYGGIGLGLSIVSALIERHGGRLTIDSEPWVGTCVSLDFPCAGEYAAPHREAGEAPERVLLAAN